MKLYAVIDTNVLVSALLASEPDTPPYRILQRLFSDEFTLLLTDEIIQEYEMVLHRDKFGFNGEDIDTLLSLLQQKCEPGVRSGNHEGVLDEKDYVFYEVAVSQTGSYLVTGNLKHFPASPIVVSPRKFLEILDGLK